MKVEAFIRLAPSKLNLKKVCVGYVYIEESFDTILNMGYGVYGSGKSAMDADERVNCQNLIICI